FLGVGAPANDIDLFIVEFAHDVFDARTAHAHTRAYWIYFFVCAPYRDLRPITGFSRDAANLHRAVGNFTHFQLKKSSDEIGMTARNDNLRAADAIFDRNDVRAESVAHIVIFYDDSFPLRHNGFKFSKVQNDVGTIKTPHSTADDLTRAVLKLLVN